MGKSSSSKRVWNNVASYCQRVQIIRYVFFLNVLFINVYAFSHYILKIGVLRLALICLIASSYFTFCWLSCERICIAQVFDSSSFSPTIMVIGTFSLDASCNFSPSRKFRSSTSYLNPFSDLVSLFK